MRAKYLGGFDNERSKLKLELSVPAGDQRSHGTSRIGMGVVESCTCQQIREDGTRRAVAATGSQMSRGTTSQEASAAGPQPPQLLARQILVPSAMPKIQELLLRPQLCC